MSVEKPSQERLQRSTLGKMWDSVQESLGRLPGEAWQMVQEKAAHGASEVANLLFTGNAYASYAADNAAAQHGVQEAADQQPATPEQKAAEIIDFQDAKLAMQVQKAVDREVKSMGPEDRRIAESFLSRSPLDAARDRAREMPDRSQERGRGY